MAREAARLDGSDGFVTMLVRAENPPADAGRLGGKTMDERRGDVARYVLPIPDQKPIGVTTYDARVPDIKFPPIRPLRPPAGAPNVLIVLVPFSQMLVVSRQPRNAKNAVLRSLDRPAATGLLPFFCRMRIAQRMLSNKSCPWSDRKSRSRERLSRRVIGPVLKP
jgi:hypothetical protein